MACVLHGNEQSLVPVLSQDGREARQGTGGRSAKSQVKGGGVAVAFASSSPENTMVGAVVSFAVPWGTR